MRFWTLCGVGVLALGGAAAADAGIVTTIVNQSYYNAPYTIALGGGNSLSLSTIDKSAFSPSPAAVATAGGLAVTSLGAPFYPTPQPSVFFANRGGSIGPDTFVNFASFASPATIPYSGSESILGFRFDAGKGLQYGYADFAGSQLHGFRYDTAPGVAVNIGSVPEPAAWALMIAGFGVVGTGLRTRRSRVFAA